jgi:3-oxoacyl-[acyl-carrier protein] reductase
MDLGLKGLRAFVGGSSRGLGYATAIELTREGCRVIINGRNKDNLEKAVEGIKQITGKPANYLVGNAADPDLGPRMIDEAAEQLGGLDLLVTNTGGPPSGKFDSFDDDAWQNAVDLVFMSHVRLIKTALPYLKNSPHPSVVTVTSYSVKQPIPNLVLSNSIRSATVGLTKSLALELGPEGIRFNSILPGWTRTERVQEIMEYRADQNGTSVEEEIKIITKECPLGRMGTPDEIGRASAFLLSPAASYINGVMLTVDGGMYKGTL